MNADFTDTFILDTQKSLANHEIRVTNLEETVKDIKDLTQTVSELVYGLKSMNDKIDINQQTITEKCDANQQAIEELKTDIQDIKDKPHNDWVLVRTSILSSIGGLIGSGVIAWIISIIKMSLAK